MHDAADKGAWHVHGCMHAPAVSLSWSLCTCACHLLQVVLRPTCALLVYIIFLCCIILSLCENWPLENKVPMRSPYAFYPGVALR